MNLSSGRSLMHRPYSAWVRFIRRYNEFMSAGFFQNFLDDYARMLSCPDPMLLEAFYSRQVPADASARIEAHITLCPDCQRHLDSFTDLADAFEISATPLDQDAEILAIPSEKVPLKPGQIWSTRASLPLTELGLPLVAQERVEASFMRLFVVLSLGPLHLGQFREVLLCPVTEWQELASAEDVMLAAAESSLDEPVMIEVWNAVPALAVHLEQYLGEITPDALLQLRQMQAGGSGEFARGGKIISDVGPHARFQALERSQVAYLQQPLAALAALTKLSQAHLLRVTPAGFTASAAAPSALFPRRRHRSQDRTLAASAEATLSSPAQAWKETYDLAADRLLDIWIEGDNLEFYAYTAEQQPLPNLQITYPNRQERLKTLETDELGTAFVAFAELMAGQMLLSFHLPETGTILWLPLQFETP